MSTTMRICASQHRMLDPVINLDNPAAAAATSSLRFLRTGNATSSSSRFMICCSRNSSIIPTTVARATAVDHQEPELEDGVSYELLRQKLQAGEWEAADNESRRLLCVLAGEAAAKRKWVYFSEVKFIPDHHLQTLDTLWREHSGDKFGFSVQRRIWKSVNSNWSAFFRRVGWTRPLDEKNDAYRKFPVEFMWDVGKPTPEGHLPLTNCLRGTQLLQEILSHPAFDEIESKEGMPSVNVLGSSKSFL